MSTVMQTVNFIQAKGLNHRQFQSFMWESEREIQFADIPYQTAVCWLSRGKVLKSFWAMQGNLSVHGQERKRVHSFAGWEVDMRVGVSGWRNSSQRLELSAPGTWPHDQWHVWCSEGILSQAAIMGDTNAPVQLASLFLLPSNVKPSQCNNVPKCTLCWLTVISLNFGNHFAVDVETAPAQIQMELIELQCNGY